MTPRPLDEGKAAGAVNMARDEDLARALAGGAGEPVVRLYGWDPPAVSIGYHQPFDDLDGGALARDGIDLVRRPTGGRAILHWNEVTYCAVLPLSLGSPREIYSMVNVALLGGLRTLGIAAELSDRGADLREAYASERGIPCFSFSVRSEIQVGGRKLVGSAQRRFGGAVLQHGSFLLGPEHRRLARYVRAPGNAEGAGPAAGILSDLEARTTDASAVLGRAVGHAEAVAALIEGFECHFPRVTEAAALRGAGLPPTSIQEQVPA